MSSILLRPHATDPNQTMLSQTSHVRVLIEQVRMDVVRWVRKRWFSIRNDGGFNTLENWALKELAHGSSFTPLDICSILTQTLQRWESHRKIFATYQPATHPRKAVPHEPAVYALLLADQIRTARA